MVKSSDETETLPETYVSLVYCILVEAEVPVKGVKGCGTKATTVVVGTVVYSRGATVLTIIAFATGAFTNLMSDGTDVPSVTA